MNTTNDKLWRFFDNEKSYRQLVETANEGIYVINPQGMITFINPRMADILGYSPQELVGRYIFDFMDEPGRAICQAGLNRRQQGIEEQQDFWFYRKDGARIDAVIGLTPIYNEAGDYDGILALVTDITERKRVEKGLLRINRALRVLSECNQALVRAADETDLIRQICRIVVEMGGYLLAWVGYAEQDEKKTVRPAAKFGYDEGYLDSIWVSWDDIPEGHGPSGTAVRTGVESIVHDIQNDRGFDSFRPKIGSRGYASVIGLPLLENDHPFGAITIYAQEKEAFDPEEVDLLRELAGDLSYGILSLRAREDRKKAREALKFSKLALDQTSDAVLWIEESGKIFDVNKAACDSLGYAKEELLTLSVPDIAPDYTTKHWKDHWKNYCHNHTCFQTRHRTKNGRCFPVEIMGDFIEYNDKLYRCVFVRDISERKRVEEALRENEERFRSLVENTMDWFWEVDADARIIYSSPRVLEFIGYTPEEVQGKTMLDLVTEEELERLGKEFMKHFSEHQPFSLFEATFLHRDGSLVFVESNGTPVFDTNGIFSGYRGITRNVTSRKKAERELQLSLLRLRNSVEETVEAMAMTVEIRDPYTAGHQRRVARLVQAIAETMGLPQDQVHGARLAAIIHDIGKIYTPAEILSKPGKISPIELSMIRTHPQVGYDILKTIEFPWPIADIVLQHHEHLDGSGYPNGLKADQMILEARIISVADVVEAMSSHRPYRPSLGVVKALEEIRDHRGTIYDAQVVDVCLKLFEEERFSFEA